MRRVTLLAVLMVSTNLACTDNQGVIVQGQSAAANLSDIKNGALAITADFKILPGTGFVNKRRFALKLDRPANIKQYRVVTVPPGSSCRSAPWGEWERLNDDGIINYDTQLPEGAMLVCLDARVSATTPMSSAEATVVYDESSPLLTVEEPPAVMGIATTIGPQTRFRGTVSDARPGLRETLVFLKNRTTGKFLSSATASFTADAETAVAPAIFDDHWELDIPDATFTEGDYELRVRAEDLAANVTAAPTSTAGTVGEAAYRFHWDNTPPDSAFVVANGRSATRDRQIVAKLKNTSDDTESYKLQIGSSCDESEWAPFTQRNGVFNITLPDLDATYQVCMTLIDKNGNVSQNAMQTITLDRVAPTISVTSLTTISPADSVNNRVQIRGSAADERSGLAIVRVSVRHADDHCLNAAGAAFDAPCPTWHQATATSNWLAAVSHEPFLYTDGVYSVTAEAEDLAGNITPVPVVSPFNWRASLADITITSAPQSPSNNLTPSVTITGNNAQSYKLKVVQGGTANCGLQGYGSELPFGPPTLLNVSSQLDGQLTLCAIGRDFNGFWQLYPVTASWIKDTVPPTLSVSPLTRTKQPVALSATSSKSGNLRWSQTSGPGTLTFGTPTALTTWVTASQDGSYQIAFRATDQANNVSSTETTLVWDTTPPGAGANGQLSFTDISFKSLKLSWTAATDAQTAASNMSYQVYLAHSPLIDDIDTVATLGTPVGNALVGSTNLTVANLTPGTTYYFNVVATDELGHKTLYQMANVTTTADTTPPVVGAGGTLNVTSYTDTSVTIGWTIGTDDQSAADHLKYFVYKSTIANIDSLANITANGGIPLNGIFGSQNINTYVLSGLTPSTRYHFAIVCEDEAGNRSMYLNSNQKTRVGPVVAAQSTLVLTGGHSSLASGLPVNIVLQARDITGAPLATGGATTALTHTGGTSTFYESFPLPGTDLGNGTYRFTITGKMAGTATALAAVVNGDPVSNTVGISVVPGAISGSTSTLATLGGSGTVASGSTATIRLTAFDFAGNRIQSGGAQVSFNVAAGGSTFTELFPLAATDRQNGTYEALVTGLMADTPAIFSASVNNAPAAASTNLAVVPGPIDIANSLVASPVSIAPGSQATLTFTARDTAGNNLRSGGQAVEFIQQSGAGTFTEATPVPASDQGDGTYLATVTGSLAGPFTIAGRIGSGTTQATTTTTVVANIAATADGQPSGSSLITAQNITVGGTGVVKYKYKIGMAASTDCTLAAGYSSERMVSLPITDDISSYPDGAIKLCIVGADFAPNWQDLATATVIGWNKIRVPPTFTSLSLINEAADTYLNLAESQLASTIAGALVAATYDTAAYAAAPAAASCDEALTYGPMPQNTELQGAPDGLYKICVKLWNTSNPPVYAAGPTFTLKKSLPDFISVSLAGEAADGYINLAERSTQNAMAATLVGNDFDTAAYKLVASSTTCDAQLPYGPAPKGDSAAFGTDGNYKICVRLTDTAGNPADYGETPLIVLKTAQPTFISLALANDASDTYINVAEHQGSSILVGDVSGTSFDTAGYRLTDVATDCATITDYGPKPIASSPDFTSDGQYKVCTKITDFAGNPAVYGASPTINLKLTAASFTSLALSGVATDGYISAADHSLSSVIAANLVATGYNAVTYKLLAASATCDGSATYGSMPQADDNILVTDGDYKICIKLDDSAGNPSVYATGPAVTLKLNAPAFTSIDLTAPLNDGYLNASENQLNTPLVSNLQGLRYDNVAYAVVTDITACDNTLSYGTTPNLNSSEFAADGSYQVCVKLTDLANNPPVFGHSASFDLKRATPTFTSLDLAGDAADGYVSSLDRQAAQPIAGNLDALNYDAVGYKLVASTSSCDQSISYGAMPTAASSDFGADGAYKVCVKLNDVAGNPAQYGSSPTFVLKTAPPTFASISLANAALDTYLNAADRLVTTPLVNPAQGSEFDHATYKIVPVATTCDSSLTYGALPDANTSDISADGIYKVCVKLTDLANNAPDYDQSPSFTVKTSQPAFISVALNGAVTDGYLNAAEHTSASQLLSAPVGSHFDTATYKVVAAAQACDQTLTYGAMPQSDDAAFATDGSYKVCVRLEDQAANPAAYGASGSITLKTALPHFTSLALAGPALDGHINLAESLITNDLSTQASGLNFDQAIYALVTDGTNCSSNAVSYGNIPVSSSADFVSDGVYKICAKLTDIAGNTPAFGSSSPIQLKRNAPVFTNIALINDAADGYITASERLTSNPLVGNLVASLYDTVDYYLVSSNFSCDNALPYGILPRSNSTDFGGDGTYKVCVKLSDHAGNPPVFGDSDQIQLKSTTPQFVSVQLATEAIDGYFSSSDRQSTSPIVTGLSGLRYDTAAYKLVTDATPCDNTLAYGPVPLGTSSDFSSDGSYKVCIRLSDNGGNPPDYGSSPSFELKSTSPQFHALALANDALDTYVNAAERSSSNLMTGLILGSYYDIVAYKLVPQSTTCDGNLSYGDAPSANSNDFTVDGLYKICAKLTDYAGNPAVYGASGTITLKTAAPAFTSVALAGDAADSYVNLAERSQTNALAAAPVGAHFDLSQFALVAASTACNGVTTYGLMPTSDSPNFGADGAYKVCVKLTDNALNPPAYGSTPTMTLKAAPPTFTALPLANTAVDGYVNAAEKTQITDLAGTIQGTAYDTVTYKLVAAAAVCASVTGYGTMPKADTNDFGADGSYKICAKLTDLAGNPAAYGASNDFSLKTALPAFTSLARGTDAADGYINAAEHTQTTDLVTSLNAVHYDAVNYKLVTANTTCDGNLTYDALPKGDSNDFGGDGSYHVCVKLTDLAGNPTVYGASPSFILKTALPDFTSLALNAAATDTYINAAESALTTDLVAAATGLNFDTATYKLVTATTNCDSSLSYGAIPKADSAAFITDGDYKVCVKLSDNAANPPDYGSSPIIHLKKTAPTFTALDLVNAAADRYVNAAEHALSTDLAGNLSGTQYDTSDYALVAGAATCDGNLTYDTMPPASAATLTTDGPYKVCVRLGDHAQNPPAYGATLTFDLKLLQPTFTGLALANEAQDSYVNATERNVNHDLTTIASGTNFDSASYKLVTAATICDGNLTYGSLPRNTSNDFGADGSYKVCTKLSDNAQNPPVYGASGIIHLKVTPPDFTSLDLAGTAADGYVNNAENQLTTDLATNLAGTQYDQAQYKLVSAATTCDGSLAYGTMPTANSGDFAGDGNYKVCVKLTDLAANTPDYGSTASFTLKTGFPDFTSVALSGAASDTYINLGERSLTTALVGSLVAANYDAAAYALVSAGTTCDASLTYDNAPGADSGSFVADGDYRVCVRVTDQANNPADYGSSATIHLKTSLPAFTSLALAGAAANGYVNAAEHLLTTDLAGPVVGAHFDTDEYKLVAAAATCDAALSYGAMPKANSNDFTGDGNYKICVKLSDHAANPAVYQSSPTFVLKTALPIFSSIALVNEASDAYISVTDHTSSQPLVGNLAAANYDTVEYKLVTASTSCHGPLTYGTLPTADSMDFTTDGSYKVCVRLTDTAGNPPAYGNSASITLKIGQPTFSSLNLTQDATDTYINAAEELLTNPLVTTVTGLSFDHAAYKLVPLATNCDDNLSYGAIPNNDSTDFGSDGDYKVCVKLTDTANNPPAFGSSPTIHLKTAQIAFTSIDLTNAATDQYINLAERQSTLSLVGNLVAANHDSVSYTLVAAATTCDSNLSYGSAPSGASSDFGVDGSYKVCLRLTDQANNPPVFSATLPMTLKTAVPTFSALPLANQAADTFINAADKLLPNAITGALVGSGYDQSDFKLVLASTSCDNNLTYDAAPLNTSNDFGSDNDYKVCVRLRDYALNPTVYNSSPTFKLKTSLPAFTSLDLAGNATDLYINAAEKTQSTTLGGTLTAVNYDSATYRLVPNTTNCNGALTYGAMPLSNSNNFGADGLYKICVKITDLAANPTVYGASPSFTLKTALPEVYGIALANGAADGYINYTEHGSAVAIADVINGAHYDTATYKLVENFVACDDSLTYGSMPLANSTDFTTDGDYKLCVKVVDYAGNPAAYASSDNIGLKTSYPTFTALGLAGGAVDRFINASEKQQATSMVGVLSATYYDHVAYTLVTNATTCDGALTYGGEPLGNAPELTSDGSYKICVKLTDNAGNPAAYGESLAITLKTVAPSFTSLSLANGATDLYINVADKAAATSLVSAAVGTDFTTATYRLVTSNTTCDSALTYGSIPLSNNILLNTDGNYKVCARLVDSAGNTPAFGQSAAFTVKTTLPTFTSLALAGDATDTYINLAERNNATALANNLVASNHNAAVYALTEATTTCDANLTYSSMPNSDSGDFSADGSYKVCVKLTDTANNTPAYGSTTTFTLKTALPAFTSIALNGVAADSYINAADRSSTQDLGAGLVAANNDAASYKLVTSATACDATLDYGLMPTGASPDFGSEGSYKVCVKITDHAQNPAAFGASPLMTLKTSAPSLTSLALTGNAADGFINASEKLGGTALVSAAVGTGFNVATYKLTLSTTTCNGSLTYGAIPSANAPEFTADDLYKVCVKLDDAAANPSVYGESAIITLKTTLPSFTSVALANGASDSYINSAEKTANTALVSAASSQNADATSYKLVSGTTPCDSNLAYGALPTSDSLDFGSDGTYKVCVKVTDSANNTPDYGSSVSFTLKVTQPSFSFLAITGDAVDGYINAADRLLNNDLAGSLAASSYNQATYKLALSSATCGNLTGYGPMPTGNSNDFGADGSYKVCVKLDDNANNPSVYGASGTFNKKTTQPGFLSLSLAGDASDGYISSTERALTSDLASSIAGVNYDQVTYKLVSTSVTCDGYLTYGAMPKANSGDFGSDGSYKVCARLIDNANNTPAYGASPSFNLRTTAPTVTSLTLAGAASDGYVNAAERSLTTTLVGTLTAAQYDATAYSLVTAATACDGQLTYGTAPSADSPQLLGADGSYKICVKVTDNAQNPPGYGASSTFTLKVNGPTFTSINLASNASDGYINLAETSQEQELVSGLAGSGYDTAEYSLVTAATTCSDGAVTYGAAVPKSSSPVFTSNGSYKVCVKLTDNANNPPVYNSSSAITLDKLPPAFTSVALSGSASNSYINASEKVLSTALIDDPQGSQFDTAEYKLVSKTTPCNGTLSFSSSKPQNDTTDFGVDGDYKVCVKLTDAAGNTPAYGESNDIHLVTTLPIFYSVSLASGDASNYYINASERQNTTDIVSGLVTEDSDFATYKLVPDATTCDSNLSYSTVPKSNSGDINGDGDYKVCVKVEDFAGNTPAYGASQTFSVKTSTPTFNTIALRNAAADQAINLAERSLTTALAGSLSAFYYDSVGYKLVTSGTTCSTVTTYGATIPAANSNDFNGDGSYKICVKLDDLAGNPTTYGESNYFALKTTAPTFTSISLASVVTDDGYVNADDKNQETALVLVDPNTPFGTDYNTAAYKVAEAGVACDGALTYSTAVPKTNNQYLSPDGNFKVCVKLSDTAGNPPAYGATSQFIRKITPPTFTSLALANETADGYINASDYSLGKAVVTTVSGSNYNTAQYKVVASNVTCTTSTVFNGSIPLSNAAEFGTDRDYKVCVMLTDNANNTPQIGYSANFALKRNAPVFTSISLANDATGGYINSGERSNTNNLVNNLSASGQNTTRYAVTLSSNNCNTPLSYDTAVPKSNAGVLGTDGIYKVCVELTDNAGNPATYGNSSNFTVDTAAPSLTLSSTAGADTKDTPIPVAAHFTEVVTGFVSGDISVTNGSLANFNGSGSSYTFDVTPTANGTVTVSVTSAVATDAAGNSNTAATNLTRNYDTAAPSVSSVSTSTASGNYGLGSTISIDVNFTEAVSVTGTPTITLNTTPTNRTASYSSGSGTSTLTFTYTVQAGDTAGRLDYVATSSLSGTIADLAGNAASLTLPATASNGLYSTNIVVESSLPSPTSVIATQPNGAYSTGKDIDIVVSYSDIMTVSGNPLLALNTSPAQSATYQSGSGTNKLTFRYTVQSGDTAGILNYSSTAALTLNGGSITDAHGTNASLTLPATAGGSALGDLSQITIDTTSATVSNVSSTLTDATYGLGKAIPITVSFSETVYVTGQPRIELNVTPSTRYAVYTSGSGTGTLTFTYLVEGPNTASGDQAGDLNYASTTALSLNGGSIKDDAGNAATLTLPGTTAAGSLGTNKNIAIDSLQPTTFAIEARTCCSASRIYGRANELTITFPSSVSNFHTVNVYSAVGVTPPADCTGTVLLTVDPALVVANSAATIRDQLGSAGQTYSYRVCAFNNGNNQMGTATSGSATTSTAQFAFVTSSTTSGNIGGVSTADSTCQSEGANFDDKLSWVALLSDDSKEAAGRAPIAGPVYSTQASPALVAHDYRDLWHGGALSQPLSYDATGTQHSGSAWTGSTATGTRSDAASCSNWCSASASANGARGNATTTSASWAYSGLSTCDNSQRFYCVSKSLQPLTSFTASTPENGTGGDITVDVTFPASTLNWTKAEVRRMLGNTPPTCSQGTVIKTYDGSTTPFTSGSFTDATGKPGALYQYTVCVYSGLRLAATYMRTGSAVRAHTSTAAHIMFVTSTKYSGNLGGLSGSPSATDALCQTRGDLVIANYTWRAVIGDDTSSAGTRINFISSGNDVRNLNGDLIIAGSSGLFAAVNLSNAVSYDDTFAQTTARVWTGSNTDGTATANHCSQWGLSNSGDSGTYGSAGSLVTTWLSNATQTCDKEARLYCVSIEAD